MVELTFDKPAMDAVEALKKTFGVDSNAKVVGKALALAQFIAKQADAENTVLLASKDGTAIKLSLAD
jgi:hypothetical protein